MRKFYGLLVVLWSVAAGASSGETAALKITGRCNAPPCSCDQQNRLTCDCKNLPVSAEELILTSEGEWNLNRHTTRISVSNCRSVKLTNNSLLQMDELSAVEFVNVLNLTLTHDSFKLSPKASKTLITVRNASIDVLPSNVFHGDVDSITLENVRINQVSAFAFANLLNTDSITLNHCQIKSLDSQAFKKFECRYLHVIGGTLGEQVPSRAMTDIEVSDQFMLDGVKIGRVESSAFNIKRPNTVAIINSAIDSLAEQAFDLTARGTVIIQNNTFGNVAFGAFLSISTDFENKVPSTTNILNPKKLMFQDNVLNDFEAGSLVFDRASFRVELSNVLINQVCDCDRLKLWKDQILNYTNAHSRLLTTNTNSEVIAPPHTLESGVDDPNAFFCLDELESNSSTSFVSYESRNCALSSSMLTLILSISGLLALLLIAACAVVYCCRKRHRDERDKRWISVPTTAPDVVNSKTKKNGVAKVNRDASPVDSRITMVVPDGRLYRETEFHVIVEKAEPLTTEL